MGNVFDKAASKLRGKAVVLPVIVFIISAIIGSALMYEDYTTSYYGYMAIPTHKVNDWVIPLVALLPQVGQIAFAYVFATDTSRRWALWITALLWFVDVFTDVYFKSSGLGIVWVGGAIVETIAIYSIGSEILLVTSIGMLVKLVPDLYQQMVEFSERLAEGGKKTGVSSRSDYQARSPKQYGVYGTPKKQPLKVSHNPGNGSNRKMMLENNRKNKPTVSIQRGFSGLSLGGNPFAQPEDGDE